MRTSGFKNKDKTYPVKIISNGLEIIRRDSIENTYTFKLIKDTAKVDCYVEGQYKSLIYWRNDLPGSKYYLVNNELKVGTAEFVIKK